MRQFYGSVAGREEPDVICCACVYVCVRFLRIWFRVCVCEGMRLLMFPGLHPIFLCRRAGYGPLMLFCRVESSTAEAGTRLCSLAGSRFGCVVGTSTRPSYERDFAFYSFRALFVLFTSASSLPPARPHSSAPLRLSSFCLRVDPLRVCFWYPRLASAHAQRYTPQHSCRTRPLPLSRVLCSCFVLRFLRCCSFPFSFLCSWMRVYVCVSVCVCVCALSVCCRAPMYHLVSLRTPPSSLCTNTTTSIVS